jgi:hypothetical protein
MTLQEKYDFLKARHALALKRLKAKQRKEAKKLKAEGKAA